MKAYAVDDLQIYRIRERAIRTREQDCRGCTATLTETAMKKSDRRVTLIVSCAGCRAGWRLDLSLKLAEDAGLILSSMARAEGAE